MESCDSQKLSNVRVTVLEDPNNSLQELFNPISQKQQVPLHQRKLPKSFFVPPRDSNDSSCLTKLNFVSQNEFFLNDFVVFHSKANSSPACLDAALRANIAPNSLNHSHQKSLDVGVKYNNDYNLDVKFIESYNRGYLTNTGYVFLTINIF